MNKLSRIAMLSTHGYFDPVPQLGRTDTGGQVVYVLELSKALARMGYKVDIFTRWFEKNKKQIDPVPGADNLNVIRIPAGGWEFIPKEFIYDVLPELSASMAALIQKEQLDYDLYHGHYVDAGVVALDVARHFNKPAFFTAHSLGAWKRDQMGGEPEEMEKKFNFRHRMDEEIRIFENVKAHTLTSQVQMEKLTALYPGHTPGNNIEIITPGVDIHYYRIPSDEDMKIQTKLPGNYIFCLSRIDTNKGHDLLLRAFAIVQREIPDVNLVIGGGSPSPQQRELGVFDMMRGIIAEHKMEDRVHIIGYVPDEMMRPYYQQSLFFVLPSQFEPFGMTSLEAMACGKTVVASKFGGIKNIISNGENSFLIDPTNAEEFASVMIRLLKEPEFNTRVGMSAHKFITENYSWDAQARKHIELYNKYL